MRWILYADDSQFTQIRFETQGPDVRHRENYEDDSERVMKVYNPVLLGSLRRSFELPTLRVSP